MPLVSVIIPTFNRARILERAIGSVLKQTFTDFELIVVDDGSTDSTKDILSRFGEGIVQLFVAHRGVSAARNAGIDICTGELVAFLDSDDEWLPEKLRRQVALYDGRDACFVCHTGEIWYRNGREVKQKPIHKKQGGRFFERALERCLISPSSVMLSKRLLDQVGWFDENLPAAEDYDLWLRVTAFHDVQFVQEPLVVKHGGNADQLSETTPAIDRYRIQAIVKILRDPRLSQDYRIAAAQELVRKCRIVVSGCRKRGKTPEAETYDELARKYEQLYS